MTLSLTTRGYLIDGRRGKRVFGKGPTITGIVEEKPNILASATEKTAVPSIIGAGIQGPRISQSTSPTSPPAGISPVITGAGVVKPSGGT